MVELFTLAGGLALDATAVAAGLSASRRPVRTVLLACLVFGGFQGGMAGLGAVGGHALAAVASGWAPWIAAGLLVGIGVWMLVGRGDVEDTSDDIPLDAAGGEPVGWGVLLGLAVATSIDALTAGVGIPHLGVGPFTAVGVIGLVTTGLCAVGAVLGSRMGTWIGDWADRIAGLVLVALGLRVAVAHFLA